jgi:hypothetical protein
MSTGQLLRPGVSVIQSVAKASPSFSRPTLVPCVVGPAYEVINVLNSDASINSGALYGAYSQIGLGITESSFPAPRGNIDELDVQESSVRPFLSVSGHLNALNVSQGFGSSFLMTSHGAAKAAIQTGAFSGATGLALVGKVLVIAVDQPARLDTSKDVTITFTGSGSNLTSAAAAAQINTAVGKTVATVVGTAPSDKVQITSPSFGAKSSITVRKGASANSVLGIGVDGSSNPIEERIEGSGYRAQDQGNNTTQSPWVEFYVGAYLADGISGTIAAHCGLINVVTGAFTSALPSALTFGAGNAVPIQVGDTFFADGVQVASGEVMKVEAARFKIGTINTALSVADSNGNYTSKVYNVQSFGTVLDPTPFAPAYAYFHANNIDWSKAAPTAAVMTGTTAGTAATAAVVTGSGALAGPFSLTGLTLVYAVTIDGVETDNTFTFTGGSYANMAAVETAIGTNIPGVAASDDAATPPQLKLSTTKVGRLQSITIKATGTANSVLGFSTSAEYDCYWYGRKLRYPKR